MIIPLNLFYKYFKSIIHYLYTLHTFFLRYIITRTERLELPMIDLKSTVLPLNYTLYPILFLLLNINNNLFY